MQPGQQLERGGEGPSRTRRRPGKNLKAGGSGDDRGRKASTAPEIPRRSWTDVLWHVYRGISDHRVLVIAGGVTFYSLLAIFPAVAALVALYSLFADPGTIRSHLDSLSNVLPGGALAVIGDQITRVSAQGQTKLGFAFAGSFLISVWSANAGIKALFDALNVVHEEREKRGFFLLNVVSLSFTLIGIALVLVAIAAMVVLPTALAYLGVASETKGLFKILRWPLLFVVVSLAISFIYRYGPSRERAQWRWLTWGSAFAAVAWLVMSILFSWYTESFGHFNETYGSLGAVIGFMIWMWLSNVVLLIGAELNAEMEHRTLVVEYKR
jgi:membrane protein